MPDEVIVKPSGGRIVGSLLLERSVTPIFLAEGTRVIDIETRHVDRLTIDIKSDVACTLQMIRLPDGSNEGVASSVVNIAANTPATHSYTDVQCGWMRIKIINTSGSNMSSFSLYIRGGA